VADSLHPDGGDYNERRRVAVNLSNEKTIEFRIFRGTINPKHILRNIEFCDAICDFCYPASRSFADTINPLKFIEFVEHERIAAKVGDSYVSVKKWPLLYAWFEHIEAIKPRKATKHHKPTKEDDGEMGDKSKYTPPAKPVVHSIGIKLPESKEKVSA
jgi:hypothetical protein